MMVKTVPHRDGQKYVQSSMWRKSCSSIEWRSWNNSSFPLVIVFTWLKAKWWSEWFLQIFVILTLIMTVLAMEGTNLLTTVPSFFKLFMHATSYLLLENGSINLIFMQTSTFPDHLIRCQQWFVKIVLIWSNSKDIFKTSSLSYYRHIPPADFPNVKMSSPYPHFNYFLDEITIWPKSQYEHQANIH